MPALPLTRISRGTDADDVVCFIVGMAGAPVVMPCARVAGAGAGPALLPRAQHRIPIVTILAPERTKGDPMSPSYPCYTIPPSHPIHCIPYHHISPYPNQLYPPHPIISIPSHTMPSHPILLHPITYISPHLNPSHHSNISHTIISHPVLPHCIYPILCHSMPCHPLLLPTSHNAARWYGHGSADRCPSGGHTPRRARCTGRAGRQGSPSGRAGTGHTAGPWCQADTGTARSPCHTAGTLSPLGSRYRLQGSTT